MNDWREELDKGNEVDIVYIGFQKASVSVSHQRFLETMAENGIQGKLSTGFETSHVTQSSVLQSTRDTRSGQQLGVDFFQGSVKRPVLFINSNFSMFQCVSSKMYVYADDAKIYPAVPNDEDAAQLRNDLDALWNWTRFSLLKFSLSNFHHVTLTGRSKRRTRSYTIDADKPLTGKECERDRWRNVDSRLYFNEILQRKWLRQTA